jgi:hypothetical protein
MLVSQATPEALDDLAAGLGHAPVIEDLLDVKVK